MLQPLPNLSSLPASFTRELGVQIESMCRSLAQFTDISCALVVGGNKNLKAQVRSMAVLTNYPVIVMRYIAKWCETACMHPAAVESTKAPTSNIHRPCPSVNMTALLVAFIFYLLLVLVQEAELRARPDIVVCTPGRMVDHLTNSASVHMDDVEILILDEVSTINLSNAIVCISLANPTVGRKLLTRGGLREVDVGCTHTSP